MGKRIGQQRLAIGGCKLGGGWWLGVGARGFGQKRGSWGLEVEVGGCRSEVLLLGLDVARTARFSPAAFKQDVRTL